MGIETRPSPALLEKVDLTIYVMRGNGFSDEEITAALAALCEADIAEEMERWQQ